MMKLIRRLQHALFNAWYLKKGRMVVHFDTNIGKMDILLSYGQSFHNARNFFLQKAKLCGGGAISTAYVMQSFHKFIVYLFCIIPPPVWPTLCKLLICPAEGHI